ncbi:GAF domain-containing protein [uncultured Jatrophihabitans sp.]|uniref:GAF domain-containing protein n=1 Tax=uncultured Jatrophihabitans sp. TaxID=1610747 RepID=UPI0035CC0983
MRLLPRADDVRAVGDAHEQFLTSGTVAPGVRAVVAESWRRSVAAGVDVDAPAARLSDGDADFLAYREAHPLSRVFPLLYDVLGRAAEECDSVLAVGDAAGRLLWVCGKPAELRRAERIDFVEGAAWDEAHAGTNAPGTALRLDAPVQILATEHFARRVQPWTCTAAPIHDPVSQAILGILDVTGGEAVASPQTLAMVRAAARMAEAELGRLLATAQAAGSSSRQPSGWSSGSSPTLFWTPPAAERRPAVSALGRPDCLFERGGRTMRLSPRHSEIVVLLADLPDGLTGDQLAVEMYADDVSASTMRAELSRLRALLGADLLDSRPYRLRSELRADWLDVQQAIDAVRPADALRAYRGPLLPQSEAPGVVQRRERLDRQLRATVLASGQVDLMAAWTRSRWGADDLDMWQRQLDLSTAGSPLHAIAARELSRLDRELGMR